jgi:hypothetical protein
MYVELPAAREHYFSEIDLSARAGTEQIPNVRRLDQSMGLVSAVCRGRVARESRVGDHRW